MIPIPPGAFSPVVTDFSAPVALRVFAGPVDLVYSPGPSPSPPAPATYHGTAAIVRLIAGDAIHLAASPAYAGGALYAISPSAHPAMIATARGLKLGSELVLPGG